MQFPLLMPTQPLIVVSLMCDEVWIIILISYIISLNQSHDWVLRRRLCSSLIITISLHSHLYFSYNISLIVYILFIYFILTSIIIQFIYKKKRWIKIMISCHNTRWFSMCKPILMLDETNGYKCDSMRRGIWY